MLVDRAIDDRSRLNIDVCPDVKSDTSSFNVILIPISLSVAAAQAGRFATLRNKIVKNLKIFMEIDYLRS